MKSSMLIVLLASAHIVAARGSEWMVVGAGNATCAHWEAGNSEQQTEILSWMAGFASAMNL